MSRTSDGRAMAGLGIGSAQIFEVMKVMRQFDEDQHKEPQPVRVPLKGSNAQEVAESRPWRPTRKDHDRDRHRHVV